MDVIAMFILLNGEIEYVRFVLAFPFPLSIQNLVFESLLTISTTPYTNDRTPPQICHVFNITLQLVPNNVAVLFTFHFAWWRVFPFREVQLPDSKLLNAEPLRKPMQSR